MHRLLGCAKAVAVVNRKLAVISLDQASAPLRLESGAVLEPRPLPYPLG